MKAYDGFKKTMSRSVSLLVSAAQRAKQNDLEDGERALYEDMGRAGIVLGVAAMDAYFTARFEELTVPFLRRHAPTEAMVEFLSKAGLNIAEAIKLCAMDRPFRRVRSLIARHCDRFTAQDFEKIDGLFLSVNLKGISENAQRKTKRKTLKRSIELLVRRRHSIAHDGDVKKHGKLREVDWKQCERRLRDVWTFVNAAEAIIGKYQASL
ncbi:MAG: hypothetical protein KJ579_04135 [Verrucomicrobia bacterium]|nr:hypothetical protein [Verrucomicrobiota bacterium]